MATFESFWPKSWPKRGQNDLRPLQSFSKNGVFGSGRFYTRSHFWPNSKLGFLEIWLVATQKPREEPLAPDPSPTSHFLAAGRKVRCPKHSGIQRGWRKLVLSHFLSQEKCLGQQFSQKTAHFATICRPKHWLLRSQCLGVRQLVQLRLLGP